MKNLEDPYVCSDMVESSTYLAYFACPFKVNDCGAEASGSNYLIEPDSEVKLLKISLIRRSQLCVYEVRLGDIQL